MEGVRLVLCEDLLVRINLGGDQSLARCGEGLGSEWLWVGIRQHSCRLEENDEPRTRLSRLALVQI